MPVNELQYFEGYSWLRIYDILFPQKKTGILELIGSLFAAANFSVDPVSVEVLKSRRNKCTHFVVSGPLDDVEIK